MTPTITDPVELRRRGFDTLVEHLGWVNAVRFIQQYEAPREDYTRQRDQILPEWNAATLLQKAKEAAR